MLFIQSNTETLEHFLFFCPKVLVFWKKVQSTLIATKLLSVERIFRYYRYFTSNGRLRSSQCFHELYNLGKQIFPALMSTKTPLSLPILIFIHLYQLLLIEKLKKKQSKWNV